METKIMLPQENIRTLRRAALIAGLAVLVMALTVPIVEFNIFPRLVDRGDPDKTANNIISNTTLFSSAIFIHFVTIICDIILAWALYSFLEPVSRKLALLTAWFRLVYTAFNVVALSSLIQVLSVVKSAETLNTLKSGEVHDYILIHINSFNLQWRFGLVFFGVYLFLLGYLCLRAPYIPKIIAASLIIASVGYLVDDLKYFFYPNVDTEFLWLTYLGELVFMFWLLIKGTRLRWEGTGQSNSSL